MRAFTYPTMAAGDSPEADVYDHQSLPGRTSGVLLQAPPEQSAGVDVCSHVQNVLLNTRHMESVSRYTGSLQAAINSY
ncbi:hypothetical protein KUCAC02_033568 [Chaenocephalus aceratus]|nr:hypothetical protein KUCAC02_033568 [Chaenocephalus aceratus]